MGSFNSKQSSISSILVSPKRTTNPNFLKQDVKIKSTDCYNILVGSIRSSKYQPEGIAGLEEKKDYLIQLRGIRFPPSVIPSSLEKEFDIVVKVGNVNFDVPMELVENKFSRVSTKFVSQTRPWNRGKGLIEFRMSDGNLIDMKSEEWSLHLIMSDNRTISY
jgi:hypothetical protein